MKETGHQNEKLPRRPSEAHVEPPVELMNKLAKQVQFIPSAPIKSKVNEPTFDVANDRKDLEDDIANELLELRASAAFIVHITYFDPTKPMEEQFQHRNFIHAASPELMDAAEESMKDFLDPFFPEQLAVPTVETPPQPASPPNATVTKDLSRYVESEAETVLKGAENANDSGNGGDPTNPDPGSP